MFFQGQIIELENRNIEVVKFLGKGKGGYSYLVKENNINLVYKKIHYEPCQYYTFGNKVLSEVEAYNKLANIGIRIPKLLEYSEKDSYILKEYVEGLTGAELLSENKLKEIHLIEIFNMAKTLYDNNTNIDFFPTNFVYKHDKAYYVDYECNELIEEWDFETWGIYFWLNSRGIKELLEKGESSKLCLPNSAKPIKDNYQEKAEELIKKYSKK